VQRIPTIYLYRQPVDCGFAPCVDGGRLLTFATCKPGIRHKAKIGDLIIGISAANIGGGRLIHIFRVTDIEEKGGYYRSKVNWTRRDCIYADYHGQPVHRGTSNRHLSPEHWLTDVGRDWKAARVLISDDFRYFGRVGTTAWLRSLIQPKEGYGICYIDWTQQEFGIAAALSNDPNMMSAYFTGDSYLAFAKMAGAVPANATKRTHKVIRENYKQCVLGKQYGMEEESLSKRINAPRIVARDLIRQHHEVFRQYWAWSDNAVDRSILEGEQQTVFGLTHHIPQNFNPRTVRNFFMQANGAEMLRIACILGTEAGIEICATLHDAILIQAPLDRLEADVEQMRGYMAEASSMVLNGFELNTGDLNEETGEFEVELIKFPNRYFDERGIKFWSTVWEIIEGKP